MTIWNQEICGLTKKNLSMRSVRIWKTGEGDPETKNPANAVAGDRRLQRQQWHYIAQENQITPADGGVHAESACQHDQMPGMAGDDGPAAG